MIFLLDKIQKIWYNKLMRKVKSKNEIKQSQPIETAYMILLNHKHRKISDDAIKTIVNLLMPYKTHIEIREAILDLMAYKDTKARVLVKSATERLEKLLKRRFA